MIDTKLVKDVVGIFVEMGGSRTSLEVYVVDFEEMLLSSTADFYSRCSSKWAEEDSFPDYMCKAEDRIKQETEDLSRMYRLFSRIATGLPPIGNIVRKHITDSGLQLVKAQSSNAEGDLMPYVQELLDLHDKYSELVG